MKICEQCDSPLNLHLRTSRSGIFDCNYLCLTGCNKCCVQKYILQLLGILECHFQLVNHTLNLASLYLYSQSLRPAMIWWESLRSAVFHPTIKITILYFWELFLDFCISPLLLIYISYHYRSCLVNQHIKMKNFHVHKLQLLSPRLCSR